MQFREGLDELLEATFEKALDIQFFVEYRKKERDLKKEFREVRQKM